MNDFQQLVKEFKDMNTDTRPLMSMNELREALGLSQLKIDFKYRSSEDEDERGR